MSKNSSLIFRMTLLLVFIMQTLLPLGAVPVGAITCEATWNIPQEYDPPPVDSPFLYGEVKSNTPSGITYYMRLTNTGDTSDTFNLSASDSIETSGGGSNPLFGSILFYNLSNSVITSTGLLNPGQSFGFYVNFQLAPGTTPGALHATLITATSTNCPGSSWDAMIKTLIVQKADSADLSISKAVNKTTAAPGETLTYTINYQNLSNKETADNVQIIDDVPNYLINITNITGGGTLSGNTITWNLGTLGTNASGSFSFQADINSSTTPGVSIINAVSITTTSSEHDPNNNSDTATTLVTVGPPASLDLTPATGSNTVGTNHTFTATVKDQYN
ncbi:MAG: DUF11 domain-containing protein, partial [Dehalococcoidaceae bacterium]|nr:DUF11 domain-containing protein [Dehalococcoidaceae bacterium]